MAHRYAQEDKFKNITLNLEQSNLHSSHILTSPADIEQRRPSTPLARSQRIPLPHSHPTLNIHIRTHPTECEEGDQRALRQLAERDEAIREKEAIILEKQEIIQQLRNIIKLSNENNSRVKPKSVIYQGEKSPDRQEDPLLKELRHNVKILTIENTNLLGYIDKLKLQLSRSDAGEYEKEGNEAELAGLKQENSRLRRLLDEKEAAYECKIDEFIVSHKSLANECKRLEHLKQAAEAENERLSLMLRDLQETRRSHSREDDRLSKTIGERTSILKIKEQYAESLRQVKQTIRIQVEDLFENFRAAMGDTDSRLTVLNRRIRNAEEQLQLSHPVVPRRKSQIYIEQGSESAPSQASARKQSRSPEESQRREEEMLLEQEVGRLKEIIAGLENQLSSRSDSYTFREHEDSSSKDERERQLLQEVTALKQEIGRLESAYHQEKAVAQQTLEEEIDKRNEKIEECQQKISQLTSALSEIQLKHQQSLEKIQAIMGAKRTEQGELTDEIQRLKKEVVAVRQEAKRAREEGEAEQRKVQQYRRLCQLLQEESQENTLHFELFSSMKYQLAHIKEKYQQEHLKWAATQSQNKEILAANQELKVKLQHSLTNAKKAADDYQELQQLYRQALTQQEELAVRLAYNEKIVAILQGELKAKKEMEDTLIADKNALEKQLVSYLSIFNKLGFEEPKNKKADPQDLPIEELLAQLSLLEASFRDIHSSRQERREMISRMVSGSIEEVEISSIRRKGSQQTR